jgi:hypothetical protein
MLIWQYQKPWTNKSMRVTWVSCDIREKLDFANKIYLHLNTHDTWYTYFGFVPDALCPYADTCDRIEDAMHAISDSEHELLTHGLVAPECTALLRLERVLLDLAAYTLMSKGVLYAFALKNKAESVVRFFEAGCFRGFMHTKVNACI